MQKIEAKLNWRMHPLNASRLTLLFIACSFVYSVSTFAADTKLTPETQQKTTFQTIKEKIRVRTFSEFMTPSITGNDTNVPTPEGDALFSTNAFNIAWIDYEVANNWRLLYWQRALVFFSGTPDAPGMSVMARNPRFALRRTNVFSVPNLTTTYDLYVQPGLAPEATTQGRKLEMGFRTNTSYEFPHSKWSMGAITEFTVSPFSSTADYYGWAMSWASYDLNKTFSTQHYATVNFRHEKGAQGLFQWDEPMPFVQNGIGVNISEQVWVSVFLNNYLTMAPTLKNTWASLWFVLTVL